MQTRTVTSTTHDDDDTDVVADDETYETRRINYGLRDPMKIIKMLECRKNFLYGVIAVIDKPQRIS